MSKKISIVKNGEPSTQLPAQELVQLNQSYYEAILAQEKHSHCLTKVTLLEAAARAQIAEAQQRVRDAFAAKEAAQKRHLDLTKDAQRTHNLTDKHAIDPLTGVVVLPES